jgi:predicted aminopeptidase
MKRIAVLLLLAMLIGIFGSGCSPFYVVRAAYEQSKILIARRPIADVLEDPASSAEERQKLQLVLEARDYAVLMGLDPGESFTKYSKLDTDTLAWVLVAARRDSFNLHTWWFPIVGRVPYKGFFDQEDAVEVGSELEKEGFEPWIRGTEAFSTLGWFNDPVLSTTLSNSPSRIVNTVIHESVHSTVWIKNNVPFNESLANFVGTEGAVSFFKERAERCQDSGACESEQVYLPTAEKERFYQYEMSVLVDSLYAALDNLYQRTDLTSEQKIEERGKVFAAHVEPFRLRYPGLRAFTSVNNAEIIQIKLYLSNLDLFRRLFQVKGQSWDAFMGEIRVIRDMVEDETSSDPFGLLRQTLQRLGA